MPKPFGADISWVVILVLVDTYFATSYKKSLWVAICYSFSQVCIYVSQERVILLHRHRRISLDKVLLATCRVSRAAHWRGGPRSLLALPIMASIQNPRAIQVPPISVTLRLHPKKERDGLKPTPVTLLLAFSYLLPGWHCNSEVLLKPSYSIKKM